MENEGMVIDGVNTPEIIVLEFDSSEYLTECQASMLLEDVRSQYAKQEKANLLNPVVLAAPKGAELNIKRF